jgi:succinate dehydrogenase flavin-adding protein (antitoxin of CptAB toxin-antitoxin module)
VDDRDASCPAAPTRRRYGEEDLKRLRWRSRRGLLELDLILGPFLERDFDQLDDDALDAYNELMLLPDNDLLYLLDGKTTADDPRIEALAMRIRRWQVPQNQQ